MTHLLKYILVFFLFSAVAIRVSSQEVTYWNAENIEMTHLKDARRYVCNPDGVLSAATVDSIDALLYNLDKTKGVEFVVVVVKRIEGGDPYVFGKELFDKYKFGKKSTDSGLLFVVSSEDRAYQILTGRGLEGTLPDAICKRIGYRIIEPLLKDDKWDEGVAMGVTSLARVIHEDQEFVEALNDDDDDIWGIGLGLGGFFAAIGLAFAAAHYSRPKCQRCGRRMNQERKLLVNKTRSAKFYSVTYRCPHCHKEMTRTERYEIESTTTVAPMFGGRGFGGGGGSMGGSFGGGSFGGGGAGGRF